MNCASGDTTRMSPPAERCVFAYVCASAPPTTVLGSRAELKQISQVVHKKARAILSYLSPNVISFTVGCFHPLIKAKNAKCDVDVKALWNCLQDAFGCNGRINIMQQGK